MSASEQTQTGQTTNSMSSVWKQICNYFTPETTHTINLHWNDEITSDAKGTFHFYFQNLNSILMDSTITSQDLEVLHDFDISCFGLAETNLAWNQFQVTTQFKQLLCHTWIQLGGAKPTMSSIDLPTESNYVTGGTATVAVGHWCSQVQNVETDPSGVGHWSSITFMGGKGTM